MWPGIHLLFLVLPLRLQSSGDLAWGRSARDVPVSIELATARSGLRTRAAWWWAPLATLALSVGVVLRGGLAADLDSESLVRTLAFIFPAALLLGATASHYAASGLALQAAAGVRLPARERYLSQLAAAAANRMTPGGVGAAALNARYLTRRGTSAPSAFAAIGSLQVLGVVADVSVLALLLAVGSAFGIMPTGGWTRLGHEVATPAVFVGHHPSLVALVGALGALVVLRRRRACGEPQHGGLSSVFAALRGLRERPRDIATMLGASAWTTMVLGIGFAASVAVVAGPGVWHDFLPLVIGYMVGSAVGNAAPIPSGIGTTDTALVGVVAASGVVMHQAVIAVLIFRVVSFWLPAALGLVAGATLRRRGAY